MTKKAAARVVMNNHCDLQEGARLVNSNKIPESTRGFALLLPATGKGGEHRGLQPVANQ